MLTSDFDYMLPESLIAQKPAAERTGSRLLVLDRPTGGIEHRGFRDLPGFLRAGDLLVLNDTKVMRARLHAFQEKKPSKRVEILLLEKTGERSWTCLAGPGRNAPVGEAIVFEDSRFRAQVVGKTEFGGRLLEFASGCDAEELMEARGLMPLPPYIRAEARENALDTDRYQTVFASNPGAVAAPTAALHFSADLLRELEGRGVEIRRLTLHVGLGTFRPVKTQRAEDHSMHEEKFCVPAATADAVRRAKAERRRVVAAGTTVVRALESFFAKPAQEPDAWHGTKLFIVPGYRFKIPDAMLTNFHLPRSTLLMLVCAFAGKELIFNSYAEAIRLKYRFYSYGDAMLVS